MRCLNGAEQITPFLRLRYHIFQGDYPGFFPENQMELDLDEYDAYSIHVGYFHIKNDRETPVGYLRLISGERKVPAIEIEKIKDGHNGRLPALSAIPQHTYPIEKDSPHGHVARQMKSRLDQENLIVTEASRFCLEKEYRKSGVARLIVESGMTLANLIFSHATFIQFASSQLGLYRFYGYQLLPGSTDYLYKGMSTCCVFGEKKNIPISVRARLEGMKEAFNQAGQICFYPNFSEYFFPPDFK